jgi:hypothetical protein
VTFTVTQAQDTRRHTVRVVTTSHGPTVCTGPKTHVFNAAEGGPPWPASCVKVGSVVRVENLGPGDLAISGRPTVSCHYEAAVHECRLTEPGTVTFTMTGRPQIRTLIVVAIR